MKLWLDLGSHRDALMLYKEYADRTEVRIDSKTERFDITIRKSGFISYAKTWPQIDGMIEANYGPKGEK